MLNVLNEREHLVSFVSQVVALAVVYASDKEIRRIAKYAMNAQIDKKFIYYSQRVMLSPAHASLLTHSLSFILSKTGQTASTHF